MLVIPQLGDDVLQTDIDQTEAINNIKDYVIEHVSITGGSYTKWNSGRLEFNLLYDPIEASGVGAHDFTAPTPFVTGNAIALTRSVGGAAYNTFTIYRALTNNSNNTINVGYNATTPSQPRIQVIFDGYWK